MSTPHLKWRHEIKERVRAVFQTLRSVKESSMSNNNKIPSRKWVKFESMNERDFIRNLVFDVYKNNTETWTSSPVSSLGVDVLYLIDKYKTILNNAIIIDRFVLEVDNFFDHLWKHAVVQEEDSTSVDLTSDSISMSGYHLFIYCIRAYVQSAFPKPGLVTSCIVDLSCIIDIDVRRKVCPLIP